MNDTLPLSVASFAHERIAVLMGGFGSEAEVSRRSGHNVLTVLRSMGLAAEGVEVGRDLVERLQAGGFTLAYNILHGRFGEDGHVQGVLELLEIPYTGENLLVSAACFHKVRTKEMLAQHGLPTSPWLDFRPLADKGPSAVLAGLAKSGLKAPLVIKLSESGSSFGVSVARTESDVERVVEELATRHELGACFAETFLPGREMTLGLLREGKNLRMLPVLELKPKKAFYDHEAKYTAGMTEMILPAPLEPAQLEELERLARGVDDVFHFSNCVRIDVIFREDGTGRPAPTILEVNTQPGMTATSDIPAMVKAAGMKIEDFLLRNLENARRRPRPF